MTPVINFWSKGQAPVDFLIFYLLGSRQLHIYS